MRAAVTHLCFVLLAIAMLASGICGQQANVGPPELALQTVHFGNVGAAVFSSDSQLIATVGGDWNARLWKADAGEVVRTLIGHTAIINTVAFGPGNRLLATGSDDATVRLWNTRAGVTLFTLKDPDRNFISALSFSPNGKMLAAGVGGGGGEVRAKIRIWDLDQKLLKLTIDEDSDGISQVGFSPDSRFLVSGGTDGKIKVWDVASGKLTRQWDAQPSEISTFAISSDGKTLVTSGRADGAIKIWNFSGELQRTVQGDDGETNCVALSTDDKTLVVGNSQVKLYELNTGNLTRTLTRKTITSRKVLVSPDSQLVLNIGVSEGGDTTNTDVYLWKTLSAEFARKLDGYTLGIAAITVAPGARLISADSDKLVTIWDLRKANITSTIRLAEEIKTVTVSPDGKTLAVAGGDFFGPGSIRLFDLDSGQLKHNLTGHLLPVRSVVFSKSGSVLVSGSGDGTIKFWDVSTGQEKRTIRNGTLPVYVVGFSTDEKKVIAASADRKINVWDLATDTLVKTLQDQNSGVFTLVFSPDRKLFITAGPNTAGFSVWETDSWKLKSSIRDPRLSPNAIQFVNNGTVVVSNVNGQVHLWNLATGKLIRQLTVHDLAGSSISLIGKDHLASASHDGAIKLLDLRNGSLMATLYRPRPGEVAAAQANQSMPEAANGEYFLITRRGFYAATPVGELATKVRAGEEVFTAKRFHSVYHRPKIVVDALKDLKSYFY